VVPVVVENDARAAALYEVRSRSAEEGGDSRRDFILVRAGTGAGLGGALEVAIDHYLSMAARTSPTA
jgi:predicted NBD/HSP70 family sugar kinase